MCHAINNTYVITYVSILPNTLQNTILTKMINLKVGKGNKNKLDIHITQLSNLKALIPRKVNI